MASNFVKDPSFCYIAPTSCLEYTKASATHLTLAHLLDTDPAYKAFYTDRAASGDFVIMDNSAYELKVPFDPAKLVDLAKDTGAKAIVLPDYPFQPGSKSRAAANEFIPLFKENGFSTCYVPQSERGDYEGWVEEYKWAASNPDIDIICMSILGIPNALPMIDPAYARVVMTSLLLDRGLFSNKHHHYLGLNSGPGLEIPSLLRMNAIGTIDSSNPIWMAILGHSYNNDSDSMLSVRKVNMPVSFGQPAVKCKSTIDRIKNNIQLTQSLFKQDPTCRTWYATE